MHHTQTCQNMAACRPHTDLGRQPLQVEAWRFELILCMGIPGGALGTPSSCPWPHSAPGSQGRRGDLTCSAAEAASEPHVTPDSKTWHRLI